MAITTTPEREHPIRTFRHRRGWTLRYLGQRSNLSESQISAMELGWLKPYPKQLKRLAKALGVRVEDLAP
jgi:transcriptional regulator with XRE-family HTH domain